MPANLADIQAEIAALRAELAETKTVNASAIVLINGFAASVTAAVTKAIQDDDAIDNSAIATVTAAIQETRGEYTAARQELGTAVVAGTPNA